MTASDSLDGAVREWMQLMREHTAQQVAQLHGELAEVRDAIVEQDAKTARRLDALHTRIDVLESDLR